MIVTLTTDFGLTDPYVGIMKGVILGIAPASSIVDLTHGVPPQDVTAGALALAAAVPYFPPGTIHVCSRRLRHIWRQAFPSPSLAPPSAA